MASLSHITRWGLPGIDHVPFEMHTCHFHSNHDQFVAALVPYFVAPPMPARGAVRALRAAWDDVGDAIQACALRILDFVQWCASSGRSKGLDVVQLWLEEEERALAEGYNGLRIAGNMSFLTPGDWSGHGVRAGCDPTESGAITKEARVVTEAWRSHNNEVRPHSSLGYGTAL